MTPDKIPYESARFAVLSVVMTQIKVLGCYAMSYGKQKFRDSVQLSFVGSKPKTTVTDLEY
jgi:hypothetical protein